MASPTLPLSPRPLRRRRHGPGHRDLLAPPPAGSAGGSGSARRILRGASSLLLSASLLLLSACERQPSREAQRIEELNLKIQQLEQRLNNLARERSDGADRKGKPPAGVIKSLTIRTGTEDDRLRIYWADGSTTDLPCTKEQATFACG